MIRVFATYNDKAHLFGAIKHVGNECLLCQACASCDCAVCACACDCTGPNSCVACDFMHNAVLRADAFAAQLLGHHES